MGEIHIRSSLWINAARAGNAFFVYTAVIFLIASFSLAARAAKKDGGFVIYPGTSGNAGAVVFSHRSHGTAGAGYRCEVCHTAAAESLQNLDMDRIRTGAACGGCHDGRTKGPRNLQTAAPLSECANCHMPVGDSIIKLGRMDSVAFSHSRHLAIEKGIKSIRPEGFSCIDCHPVPFERGVMGVHRMDLPHERGGCAQCHNGRKRRDGMPVAFAATARCLTCHKPAESSARKFALTAPLAFCDASETAMFQ